jgi:hypothetical protein
MPEPKSFKVEAAGYLVQIELVGGGQLGAVRSNILDDGVPLPALSGAKLMAEHFLLELAIRGVDVADPIYGSALGEALFTVMLKHEIF